MTCQRRQGGDYTRLGTEVKTGARILAMRRIARIRGVGVFLLAATGLMACVPGCLQAQQMAAQKPDSPKSEAPNAKGADAVGPPASGNQKKVAPEEKHRFWD